MYCFVSKINFGFVCYLTISLSSFVDRKQKLTLSVWEAQHISQWLTMGNISLTINNKNTTETNGVTKEKSNNEQAHQADF